MTRRFVTGALILLALLLGAGPMATGTIVTEEIHHPAEAHLNYLASDSLEGRLPGTQGIEKAADYIAQRFEASGLEPAFGDSYFQEFEIQLGITVTQGPFLQVGDLAPVPAGSMAVIPISGSGGGRGDAFDLRLDDGPGTPDAYPLGGIVFLGIPPEIEELRWTMMGRDGLLEYMRDQAVRAEEQGVAGVVFVSETQDDAKSALHYFPLRRSYNQVGIPVLEITLEGLPGLGNLGSEAAQACSISVALEPRNIRVKNVGGVHRGAAHPEECVVVGAHYDHLGYGDIASSTPWRREVHNGADDNASGVAALIEIANRIKRLGTLDRSVVFVSFTAEELGALGSEYYCKHPPFPIDSTVAMINLDTVGRLENDKLIVFGAKSAVEMDELLDGSNSSGLDLVKREEIYGFSDQNPFYARGVPSLHLFTGAYDDYHSPDDDVENLNIGGLVRLIYYAADLTRAFANAEHLTPVIKAEEPSPPEMSRGSGAFLGIVPDFAYSGTGVGLKGTVPESPAEAAGLEDGDVIVSIDGKPIADLRALMYFLAAGQPGDEIEIQIMRGSAPEVKRAVLSVRSKPKQSE